jgi:hypothetical protein
MHSTEKVDPCICMTPCLMPAVVVLGGDLYVERRSKLPPAPLAAAAGAVGTLAVGC